MENGKVVQSRKSNILNACFQSRNEAPGREWSLNGHCHHCTALSPSLQAPPPHCRQAVRPLHGGREERRRHVRPEA